MSYEGGGSKAKTNESVCVFLQRLAMWHKSIKKLRAFLANQISAPQSKNCGCQKVEISYWQSDL